MGSKAGILVLFVLVSAVGIYMIFSNRHSDPAVEFSALELAAGDAANTPTCYSLATALVANNLTGDARRTWTSRVFNEWTLRIDNGRQWRTYTFMREGDLVVPLQVVSSEDLPQIGDQEAVAAWVRTAKDKNAPRMARCSNAGS
jgi:hypothetical protein